MTIPTQLVLQAPLQDPRRELYGIEIGTAAGPTKRNGAPHPGPTRGRGLLDAVLVVTRCG